MTAIEAQEIFKDRILAHWPNWPNNDAELRVWVRALTPFDATLARDAIDELYAEWDKDRYPKMPQILKAIRKQAKKRRQQTPLVKLYQIEDEEGKQVWKPFWGKSGIARQELEPEAERLCQEADRMFPGHKHITRWFRGEDEEDHGYYGPDARERAFKSILEGPDSKTRRWLEAYLARKNAVKRLQGKREQAVAKAGEQKDLLTIGQVLQDDIPF